jgi:hypothetical protein
MQAVAFRNPAPSVLPAPLRFPQSNLDTPEEPANRFNGLLVPISTEQCSSVASKRKPTLQTQPGVSPTCSVTIPLNSQSTYEPGFCPPSSSKLLVDSATVLTNLVLKYGIQQQGRCRRTNRAFFTHLTSSVGCPFAISMWFE